MRPALLLTNLWQHPSPPFRSSHRRRIKTEEKSKVVPSVWGEEFIQFLAAPIVLHRAILIIQYSQSNLPPRRPLCGEAPGQDSNPVRADLVAGTLTTRPPGLFERKGWIHPSLQNRPSQMSIARQRNWLKSVNFPLQTEATTFAFLLSSFFF